MTNCFFAWVFGIICGAVGGFFAVKHWRPTWLGFPAPAPK